MSNIKVSNLPDVLGATPTQPDDTYMIVQGGANKKIQFSKMLNNLFTNMNIRFGGHMVDGVRSGVQVIIKDKHDGDLFYVDTDTKQVGIGAPPTLTNAKLQISGNVKIDALYIDSFELVDTNRSGGVPGPWTNGSPKSLSLSVETSQLRLHGENYYTLSKGIPGQTKNIVVVSAENNESTDAANIKFTHGGALSAGRYNTVRLVGSNAGCVLKYVEDTYAKATADAVIAGNAVSSITITYTGANYNTAPVVSFINHPSDTTGFGATATATISAEGKVTAVNVTNGGADYTQPPTVVFTSTDHEYWVVVANNGATFTTL